MPHVNLVMKPNQFSSSFLAYEKDMQAILRRLFIESRPYSEMLKRLLVINTKDCLDNTQSVVYNQKLNQMTLTKLKENGYIRLAPKLQFDQHNQVQSYIIMTFKNFVPSQNPQFRDCTIVFDILCHTDYWDIGDYRLRPLKIAGYIDGILNHARLSGIGTLQFLGCDEIVLGPNLAGYTLLYKSVNGVGDDRTRKMADPPPGAPVMS